jgi:hypothetical protein
MHIEIITNLHRKTIISEVRANKAFLIHVMKISVLAKFFF